MMIREIKRPRAAIREEAEPAAIDQRDLGLHAPSGRQRIEESP